MPKIRPLLTMAFLLGIGLVLITSVVSAERVDMNQINLSEYAPDEIVVKFKGSQRFDRIKLISGESVPSVLKKYASRRDIEYAEPNFTAFALETPADPFYDQINRDPILYPDYTGAKYGEQWALDNEGKTNGAIDADIDWQEAYAYLQGITLDKVVVAVVDSGMDVNHPDLNAKIYGSYSVLDNTANVPDDYGHGTHVAGTVGAETANYETDHFEGVASVGFMSTVKLFPIKVLDENGSGTNADVAEGIYWAADHGAQVINLSLGSYWDSQSVKDAVDYAWNKGLILTAAAGNSGSKRKVFPAFYENVISVSATDHNDHIAGFSTHNSGVDVSAPGVDILSTFPYTGSFQIQDLYGRKNQYDVGSGTSMAAPHVAGLAALLFSQHSDWSNQDVRTVIETAVDDQGKSGWDEYYGHGRINVYKAVTTDTVPSPTPTPTPGKKGGRPK